VDVSKGLKAVEKLFSPEFRNRLTEVVTFDKLPAAAVERIVDKFMAELTDQLKPKGVSVEMSSAARKWFAEHGYDETFGARPLARLIQKHVRRPLANALLFGDLEHGGTARVDLIGDELVVETKPGG
jgi:ATP-dependent Clp protease ATP-binding subunit ClpA